MTPTEDVRSKNFRWLGGKPPGPEHGCSWRPGSVFLESWCTAAAPIEPDSCTYATRLPPESPWKSDESHRTKKAAGTLADRVAAPDTGQFKAADVRT